MRYRDGDAKVGDTVTLTVGDGGKLTAGRRAGQRPAGLRFQHHRRQTGGRQPRIDGRIAVTDAANSSTTSSTANAGVDTTATIDAVRGHRG